MKAARLGVSFASGGCQCNRPAIIRRQNQPEISLDADRGSVCGSPQFTTTRPSTRQEEAVRCEGESFARRNRRAGCPAGSRAPTYGDVGQFRHIQRFLNCNCCRHQLNDTS